ncbi:MAG: hypothetical protein SFU55_09960 [Methylophilus sp.]|nr:hypothetical protein [Methylophilus sp.]
MSEEIKSLEDIWHRIQRILTSIEAKSDLSFSQSYIVNGISTKLRVTGIKSPEQLEDELLHIFLWLWSIKDYLKAAYKKLSLEPKVIEELVNRKFTLQLISDIANRSKHSSLEESRSKKYAILTKVGIDIPQRAISQMAFEANKITMNVDSAQEVILRAGVEDIDGQDICDAFEVIWSGLEIWEAEVSKINLLSNT